MDENAVMFFVLFTVVLGVFVGFMVCAAMVLAAWIVQRNPMLVLKRKALQSILIGEDIRIIILSIENGKVKIGIEAPNGVKVVREELLSPKSTMEQYRTS